MTERIRWKEVFVADGEEACNTWLWCKRPVLEIFVGPNAQPMTPLTFMIPVGFVMDSLYNAARAAFSTQTVYLNLLHISPFLRAPATIP